MPGVRWCCTGRLGSFALLVRNVAAILDKWDATAVFRGPTEGYFWARTAVGPNLWPQ